MLKDLSICGVKVIRSEKRGRKSPSKHLLKQILRTYHKNQERAIDRIYALVEACEKGASIKEKQIIWRSLKPQSESEMAHGLNIDVGTLRRATKGEWNPNKWNRHACVLMKTGTVVGFSKNMGWYVKKSTC